MEAKHVLYLLGGLLILAAVYGAATFFSFRSSDSYDSERGRFLNTDDLEDRNATSTEESEEISFKDTFDEPRIIYESGQPEGSSSENWWLSSGGIFKNDDGLGRTNTGDIGILNPWYWVYLRANPLDTDSGFHPQNIFRLVETRPWENAVQTVYFRIEETNESDSPNRNESNGVLLFNRYQTSDDLYYSGLRVDGQAVIKKKLHGTYYTLAITPVFTESAYDRNENPNVLPEGTWIGLRSEIETKNSAVELTLSVDIGRTGAWSEVLTIEDTQEPILDHGFAGIRTDFMDVSFDEYSVEPLTE